MNHQNDLNRYSTELENVRIRSNQVQTEQEYEIEQLKKEVARLEEKYKDWRAPLSEDDIARYTSSYGDEE